MYGLKKTLLYKEGKIKIDQREQHQQKLLKLVESGAIIVFQDETGLQEDITREYGRIGKDENGKAQKLIDYKTAIKHTRTSIISGYTKLPNQEQFQYIAPFIFNGICCTNLYNFWLEKIFVPEVKKLKKLYRGRKVVLVQDNAAFHKSDETLDICEKYNIELIFQPAYSPDLNPIEPSWNTLKNNIRSQFYTENTFQEKLINALLLKTW